MTDIRIKTEYITLGQLLKLADLVSTGGEAKALLAERAITVNGEAEARRGRKLRDGDTIVIAEAGTYRIRALASDR